MLQHVLAAGTVTAIYDVVLQILIKNKCDVPFKQSPWYTSLGPYFEAHTPLAAALLAFIIGSVAQFQILSMRPQTITSLLGYTFVISALLGFPMRWSRLFPRLNETYYKKLGNGAVISDGISGLIVQITLILFGFIRC